MSEKPMKAKINAIIELFEQEILSEEDTMKAITKVVQQHTPKKPAAVK